MFDLLSMTEGCPGHCVNRYKSLRAAKRGLCRAIEHCLVSHKYKLVSVSSREAVFRGGNFGRVTYRIVIPPSFTAPEDAK